MGNAGLTTPRVILSSELQLHFQKASINEEVAEVVSGWFEDGACLGLTQEMFSTVLALQGQAKPFFDTFDTDRNQKVDAFEVLSGFAILAKGTIDEKIEVIFTIFDFAGNGHLNFDETNILVHSVYRGLRKVCHTKAVDDNEIVEVCRRLFDSHNLPYDKQVTKEQLRRWLRSDVEAASFIDVFHNGLAVPEAEAGLTEREQTQANVFSNLCGSLAASEVPAQELSRSQPFRDSLGSHSEEAFLKLIDSMSRGGAIGPDSFARAVRAWNIFSVVDASAKGELDAKELSNLAFFQYKRALEPKELEELRGRLGLNSHSRITRTSWIEVTR